MTDLVEKLVRDLRLELPGARVLFESFPSGAAWLDVFTDDRWFQLVYFPSTKRFGVDETTEEDAFSNYYRFTSFDFNAAASELRRLIAEAAVGLLPHKAAV